MAPSVLEGNDDTEKLKMLSTFTYKEQGIWFLNSYWDSFGEERAEDFWKYVQKMAELDAEKGKEGCEVDELQAHRFLEAFDMPETVRETRENLRACGAIGQRVKLISLVHLLIVHFKVDFHELVNASQGDNQKEIQEAQELLRQVQEALVECERTASEARKALVEAQSREAEAHASAEAAKAREAEAHASAEVAKARESEAAAAQAELEAALAELKAQEDAYNQKTEDLKRKSEEGGLVSRQRAKNELAQHLAEDPLPLRRAKINQEAAVRKADKTRAAAQQAREKAEADAQAASEARVQAEADAQAASEARAAAEAAKAEAEAALQVMEEKCQEAEQALSDLKAQGTGSGAGSIWFMERELFEARKYMPVSKGGVR